MILLDTHHCQFSTMIHMCVIFVSICSYMGIFWQVSVHLCTGETTGQYSTLLLVTILLFETGFLSDSGDQLHFLLAGQQVPGILLFLPSQYRDYIYFRWVLDMWTLLFVFTMQFCQSSSQPHILYSFKYTNLY